MSIKDEFLEILKDLESLVKPHPLITKEKTMSKSVRINGSTGGVTLYPTAGNTYQPEDKKAKEMENRIKQLEDTIRILGYNVPAKPDPNLAEDEWYAIFPNFEDMTSGTITKIPWQGGSNMTATFIVKKI